MKYKDLHSLLEEQGKKWLLYKHDLVNNILELRTTLIKLIDAPEGGWQAPNSNEMGRYIDVAVPVDGSPSLNFSNVQDCPQEDGCLFFLFKIGLTKAEGVFPIRYFQKKIAIKYKDNVALFSTSDPENISNGNWSSDKEKISNEIVKLLAEYLSYDPFNGPQLKNAIGFGFHSERK